VSDDDLAEAVRRGITKVNIATRAAVEHRVGGANRPFIAMDNSPPLSIIALKPTISTSLAEALSYTQGATTQLVDSYRSFLSLYFAIRSFS
jgi:hypothetical protein